MKEDFTNKENKGNQAKGSENTNETLNRLREFLTILDDKDLDKKEMAKSSILEYFETIRKSSNPEKLGELIKTLRGEITDGTEAAYFLDISSDAYDLIVESAYKRMIRSICGTYKIDGTVARCPKCKSTNVAEGDGSFYEFTEMICSDCGYKDLADDYQLEDWYPL